MINTAKPNLCGNIEGTADKPTNLMAEYNALSGPLKFKTDAEAMWWAKTAPIFVKLMESAGYSPEHLHRHLEFYQDKIVPALGPYPPKWLSVLTHDGLPVEFSMTYQEGRSPVVRIAFEPVNENSGTEKDTYNQKAIAEFSELLSSQKGFKDFDDQLFTYFASEHALDQKEKEILRNNPADRVLNTQLAYGFDLKGNDILVKGYSFMGLKCKVSGQNFGDLVGKSIYKWDEIMDCSAVFANINSFMNEINGYGDMSLISWDCIAPRKSRIKLYGISSNVTWSMIERVWNLDGRAQRPSDIKGLVYLRKLWDILEIKEHDEDFKIDFGDDGTKNDVNDSPICWNYEMKSGDQLPYTKIYLPLYGESDLKNVTALAHYFDILGWKETSAKYASTVQSLYPGYDLSKTTRLLSWVSFTYTPSTGVYLSVYYHSSLDSRSVE